MFFWNKHRSFTRSGKRSNAAVRPVRQSCRLCFEMLEDRNVPALAAPSVIAPLSVIMDDAPTFSWNTVVGAKFYEVLVNNVTTGQSQVIHNAHVNGASLTATTPLNLGQSYQWFVRAMTDTVKGPWSAPALFDVINPFAGAYSGTYSGTTTDGDVFTDLPVSATVDGSGIVTVTDPGPGHGSVDLSGGAFMTGTFGFGSVTDADYAFTGTLIVTHSLGLQILGTGTWTAAWVGGSGSGTWEVSAAADDLLGTPLDAPIPSGPNATITNARPMLQWSAVAGASYYECWIDDLTTGQSEVLSNLHVSATWWTLTTSLVPDHDYQWYVKAVDSGGRTSATSGPTAFSMALLGSPILSSPSGAVASKAPNLTWAAVTDASSYEVWVHDVLTGVTVVDKQVAATNLTVGLTLGHAYQWRVRAFTDNGNFGPWSGAEAFSIIVASPTISGPSGDLNSARPTFIWNSVANASYYDVRVDDVTTGQIGARRNPKVIGTSWTAATLIPGHQYQWWVRAVASAAVSSAWSSTTVFTVIPLDKPTPVDPTGFIENPLPTFAWNTVTGADYYDVQVKSVSTGLIVLRNAHVTGTSWTSTLLLSRGQDYLWQVRALSNNGNVSVWTAPSRFTVMTPFAGVYTGSYTGTASDEGPVSGPVEATINVAGAIRVNDPGTGSGSVDLSGAAVITGKGVGVVEDAAYTYTGTFAIVGGVTTGSGTWTAKWVGGNGSGTWSVTATSTLGSPLNTPIQTAPTGDTAAVKPTFTWNTVPRADYYDIWVNDLTTKTSQVLRNVHVTAATWMPATNLVVGHQYQWRVQALNDQGDTSPWSAFTSFKIILAQPVVNAPLTGSSPGTTPTFSWNAVSSANYYDVRVDDLTTGTVARRNTKVLGTTAIFSVPLPSGHNYRWTVRAFNNNGTVSLWSDPQDLTV